MFIPTKRKEVEKTVVCKRRARFSYVLVKTRGQLRSVAQERSWTFFSERILWL